MDNEVFELIQRLIPSAKIKWNIEMIGNVRESIRARLINERKLVSEIRFYPFIKIRNPKRSNRNSTLAPDTITARNSV